jgi:hypothetical protein
VVSAIVLAEQGSVVKEVGPVPILLTPHLHVFWLLLAGVAYQGFSELLDIVSSTLMAAIDAPGTLADMAATLAPDTLVTMAALYAPAVRMAMAADAPATAAAYAPVNSAADAPVYPERSLMAITQAAGCAPHVIRQCLLTLQHLMAPNVVMRFASTVIGNRSIVARSTKLNKAPPARAVLAHALSECLPYSVRGQGIITHAYRLRLLRASSHRALCAWHDSLAANSAAH